MGRVSIIVMIWKMNIPSNLLTGVMIMNNVYFICLSSDSESYIDKIDLFTGFSHFKDGKNINISCYSL